MSEQLRPDGNEHTSIPDDTGKLIHLNRAAERAVGRAEDNTTTHFPGAADVVGSGVPVSIEQFLADNPGAILIASLPDRLYRERVWRPYPGDPTMWIADGNVVEYEWLTQNGTLYVPVPPDGSKTTRSRRR